MMRRGIPDGLGWMKKNRVLIFLAVVLAAFAAGCAREAPRTVVNASPPNISVNVLEKPNVTVINITTQTGCEFEANVEEKDDCFFKEALAGNWSQCGRILSSQMKDECVFEKAKALNDSNECGKIFDASLKNRCRVFFELAECENKAGIERLECRALILKNASECSGEKECIFYYARRTGDAGACAEMREKLEAKACEALAVGNPGVCEEFSLRVQIDGCLEKYAVEANEWSACKKISIPEYSDSCFKKLAIANNDSSMCFSSSSDLSKDDCYAEVARASKNPEPCGLISTNLKGESNKKDICYYDVAKSLSDASVCARIKNDYYRNFWCYYVLIESGEYPVNASVCEKIIDRDYTWRDKCFYRLVREYNESRQVYCPRIVEEVLRKTCEQS